MLAKEGYSVLLWDLDPQGGSSFFFNLQNSNNHSFTRLFDRHIPIYDVIRTTDTHHIDIISNDSYFSDQFMIKSAKITALSFLNHDLIKETLKEIEDDYDFCLIDCSPGKFFLHDNIFTASDLILVPNIPSPLSVYCNNIILESIDEKVWKGRTILGFYNMVQVQKNIHKFFLQQVYDRPGNMLHNYIPFYAEIENITYNKESIFHQLKQAKTSSYYESLWKEICSKMNWSVISKPPVVLNIDHNYITQQAII